jgi:hypothetical protein
MCLLAIIISGSLVLSDERQPQESPTAPQKSPAAPLGMEGKASETFSSQSTPRAESAQAGVNPGEPKMTPSQGNVELHFATMNEVILDILVGMPKGGGYDASSNGISLQMLSSAIRLEGNHLVIEPEKAKPSLLFLRHYLVFWSHC